MQPIQIDAELAKKLQEAGKEVPLVGPDGVAQGVVVDAGQYEMFKKMAYHWAKEQVTLEDLQKSMANPKKHTMEEVMRMVEGR